MLHIWLSLRNTHNIPRGLRGERPEESPAWYSGLSWEIDALHRLCWQELSISLGEQYTTLTQSPLPYNSITALLVISALTIAEAASIREDLRREEILSFKHSSHNSTCSAESFIQVNYREIYYLILNFSRDGGEGAVRLSETQTQTGLWSRRLLPSYYIDISAWLIINLGNIIIPLSTYLSCCLGWLALPVLIW